MTERGNRAMSRRGLYRATGKLAAASALAGVTIPAVHAGEDNTIRLALIGCGGRGTGAVGDALSSPNGPTQLVAMADLFEDRLANSYKTLSTQYAAQVDVPPERKFIGFDAFKQAIDCLRPGDVAMLTTHAAFRQVHFDYAVEKGVNVFMEKSFAPDPGSTRRVLKAGQLAAQKNLKVACGLMCRHSVARAALIDRLRGGELGSIELVRANRLGPDIAMGPYKPEEGPELLWQIRRPYAFHWLSSGLFIEMTIHQIDECCWIYDGWPVSASGLGGRTADSEDCSQNLDSYGIEYTFPGGGKALVQGRYLSGCFNEFATYIHGSKRAAQFSGNIHAADVHTYKGKEIADSAIDWKPEPEPCDPWHAEWNDLLAAIRQDTLYNEVERACMANLASIMGRAAVHTGKIVTWDEITNSSFQFCDNVDALTADSTPPAHATDAGTYEVPGPRFWRET